MGYVPGKSVEKEKIESVEKYRLEKLEPLLKQAISGEKAVFFVDAAHFVHRAYLGFLWCFTRTFICSPSGRKRFNVLGAVNAVTKEIITITNETYINSESSCQLLFKLTELGLSVPIVLVLDNAKYQKCKIGTKLCKRIGYTTVLLTFLLPTIKFD